MGSLLSRIPLPYSTLMVFGVASLVLIEVGEQFHAPIAMSLLQGTWIRFSILLVLDAKMMSG